MISVRVTAYSLSLVANGDVIAEHQRRDSVDADNLCVSTDAVSGDADSLSVNAGLCGVSTNSCSVKIAAFDRVMALDRVVIGKVVVAPDEEVLTCHQ